VTTTRENRLSAQRTFFIVKPDAVERRLIGKILAHVEGEGFRVVGARLTTLARREAETFYAEHAQRPFFGDLVAYMTSGPVLLACLEREDAVAQLRRVVGATDPAEAAAGTVRKLYGKSKQENSVHASDSPASAEREIRLMLGDAVLAA
jgi:nucleoside-diphosphate kinase